jgi:hypothetical protein
MVASVAFHAVYLRAFESLATVFRLYPRPVLPRRVMPHMTRVTAFKLGDPMPFLVFAETDYRLLHAAV